MGVGYYPWIFGGIQSGGGLTRWVKWRGYTLEDADGGDRGGQVASGCAEPNELLSTALQHGGRAVLIALVEHAARFRNIYFPLTTSDSLPGRLRHGEQVDLACVIYVCERSRGGFRSTSSLLDLSARVDDAAKPTLRIDKRELSHVSSVTVTFLSPLKDNATMRHLDKYVETIYRNNKGERLKPSFLIFLAEAAGCPLRDGPIANQTHAERLS
ncbi:hypothetical protein ALC53_09839 [Atta colombica]|uniref:Uncharacterized protein n=1 Tax=Atta colombica TaxID=520822 RepID=A0A195B633_9HYME|nr:hypothetical protein ALC53_09839 [Atta colombica]